MPIDTLAPATRAFEHVVAHFQARDWPMPERRYRAVGALNEIAADGGHLLIALAALLPGPSDTSEAAGGLPPVAAAMVPARASYVFRWMDCVPVVDGRFVPTAEDIDASAERLLPVPGRLLEAIRSWLASERGRFTAATVGQVDPLGPEGGLAGFEVYVTVGPPS